MTTRSYDHMETPTRTFLEGIIFWSLVLLVSGGLAVGAVFGSRVVNDPYSFNTMALYIVGGSVWLVVLVLLMAQAIKRYPKV